MIRDSSSIMNLGGADNENAVDYVVKHFPMDQSKFRPHKPFRNWARHYRIPWICFIEIAIMVVYFVFGYFHTTMIVDSILNFAKIFDDYFLKDYGFTGEDDDGICSSGSIYFKSTLLKIANETGQRLFDFPKVFPISVPFYYNEVFDAVLTTENGNVFTMPFSEDNNTLLYSYLLFFLDRISELHLETSYKLHSTSPDDLLNINVSVVFTLDPNSRYFTMDIQHTRIPRSVRTDSSNINDLLTTLPIFLIVLSIIAIVLTLNFIYSVHAYAVRKAKNDFVLHKKVFWKKLDKWSIYALITHLCTLIAAIVYIANDQNYDALVPYALVLEGFSSSMHCILLIRYLKQKPSTMIIVNVIVFGGIRITQFLIGCVIIFAGYSIAGISLMGTYSEEYSDVLHTLATLIAVIHGDSLMDIFTSVRTRQDTTIWIGFFYMTIWVIFSLTIMFNISISIFEIFLTIENEKYRKSIEKQNETTEATPLSAYAMVLPLNYRQNY